MSCHNSPSGTIAGWDFANLTGPSKTSPERSQLDELERLGIVKGIVKTAWKASMMVDPADEKASLEIRARSYLSINCSHCHCRGGGGTVALELPFSNSVDKLNAINELPTQGTFGLENARVILPGDPYSSILYYRMATCGAGHMPKLWARENDSLGLQLVHDWIASMDDKFASIAHDPQLSDEYFSHLEKKTFTANDALREFHFLLFGKLEVSDQKHLLKMLTDKSDPIIRGLAERFVPLSERIPRLGANIDRPKVLALQGDAQQGSIRYRESAAMQCRNCHRIAGAGQSVGPDLDGIAKKRSREDLLESLIEPSRRIEPEHQSHSILTTDGTTITGLLVERSERGTSLRSADGKLHTIAADEIEEARVLGVSLMPAGLVGDMTAEELADLLALLESLK